MNNGEWQALQIENHCSHTPCCLLWQVSRALRLIDPEHLQGLAFICLMDQMPAKLIEGELEVPIYGWYHPRLEGTPPYIVLYVPRIYLGIPWFLWWSTIPTLRIARSLAHEVAHHLDAKRGYILELNEKQDEKESFANSYADEVLKRMARRWPYKLGVWGSKELAGWYYAFANVDWREKNYCEAAQGFYKAWDLDPNHHDAAYWYWRAKELCAEK